MNDQREAIVRGLIRALQEDQIPWRQSWGTSRNRGLPRNFLSGKPYRGLNCLGLMGANRTRAEKSCVWGTEKQWRRIGGVVRPRPAHFAEEDWGYRIIFAMPLKTPDSRGFLIRPYVVYNADLIDPVDDAAAAKLEPFRSNSEQHRQPDFEPAENLLRRCGADIRVNGCDPCYHQGPPEYIELPHKDQFASIADFYEAAFHEIVHWSVPRVTRRPQLSYAFGELVAEIGAAFISADLGVPMAQSLMPQHHSYLAEWLSYSREDWRFLLRASTFAARCVDSVYKLCGMRRVA